MSEIMTPITNPENPENDLIITDKDDADDDIMDRIPDKIIAPVVKKMAKDEVDEDPNIRQNLIFKIQKYQDSELFGDIVKTRLGFKQGYDELNDKSISELENMLSRIRIHLDNMNLDRFYERTAESIAVLYESVVSLVYDIDGFSDLLLDSDDFWNIYERFKIENNFPAVNPAVQLSFMIAQSTFMAHHLAMRDDKSGENHTMEDPPPLETIIEEIESQSPTPETTTPKSQSPTSESNDEYVPKPIVLGGAL